MSLSNFGAPFSVSGENKSLNHEAALMIDVETCLMEKSVLRAMAVMLQQRRKKPMFDFSNAVFVKIMPDFTEQIDREASYITLSKAWYLSDLAPWQGSDLLISWEDMDTGGGFGSVFVAALFKNYGTGYCFDLRMSIRNPLVANYSSVKTLMHEFLEGEDFIEDGLKDLNAVLVENGITQENAVKLTNLLKKSFGITDDLSHRDIIIVFRLISDKAIENFSEQEKQDANDMVETYIPSILSGAKNQHEYYEMIENLTSTFLLFDVSKVPYLLAWCWITPSTDGDLQEELRKIIGSSTALCILQAVFDDCHQRDNGEWRQRVCEDLVGYMDDSKREIIARSRTDRWVEDEQGVWVESRDWIESNRSLELSMIEYLATGLPNLRIVTTDEGMVTLRNNFFDNLKQARSVQADALVKIALHLHRIIISE